MKKVEIKGIIPPIVTPMYEDESINTEELRRQVDRQIENGAHALFCFGTNGDGFILNGAEKKLILETVVDQTAGRVPVYAGTGCISTKETIEQSKMAEAAGADVLSIITPSFAKASQAELYTHYEAVAKAVDMPIVLYNIPARTGNALEPETVARLAEIDNIVGAKDSSGNFDNLKAYIERTKDKDFAILAGNDGSILGCLKAGGAGGIAGRANVYPHTMAEIYNCFAAGDLEKAQYWQDSVLSLGDVLKLGNPNTIIKIATNLVGYPVGPCRAPFNQISEEGLAALKKVLEENRQKGLK